MTNEKKKPARAARKPRLKGSPTVPELSVIEMRRILRDEVLSNNQVMPSNDAVAELTRRINEYRAMRRSYLENWQPHSQKILAARRGAEALLKVLPTIQENTRQILDDPDRTFSAFAKRQKEDLKMAKAAQAALTHLLNHSLSLFPMTAAMEPMDMWTNFARALGTEFCKAMRPSNPTLKISLSSNDGPAPRFVASVLPYVTGDAPTALTVGQELKRQARGARDKS